ncbi:MAG: hypothetical protein ACI4DK_01155 [Lachnospiraceae bacterium]
MGIGKIGGFYQSYPIQPIKQVDVETVKAQEALKKQQEEQLPAVQVSQDAGQNPDTRSRIADLENISLNFNTGDTYDYIGRDSDLSLLDVDQVLSDMKKDSVLDQYRYFVGDISNVNAAKEGLEGDGIVIMK